MVDRRPHQYLWLVAGFLVWTLAFVVIYTLQSVGCAVGWSFWVHRLILTAALLVHCAAILLLIRNAPGETVSPFLATVSVWTLWAALVSTVLTYGPAFFVSACI